jgi:hypothetical protein
MCTRVFWSGNGMAKVAARTMDWQVSDRPLPGGIESAPAKVTMPVLADRQPPRRLRLHPGRALERLHMDEGPESGSGLVQRVLGRGGILGNRRMGGRHLQRPRT